MKLIDKYRDTVLSQDIQGTEGRGIDIVCVDIRNVAEWFYMDVEEVEFPSDSFPCLAPPWPVTWFEWTRPSLINLGGKIHRDIKCRIGVMLIADDVSFITDDQDPMMLIAERKQISGDIGVVRARRQGKWVGRKRKWMITYKIYIEFVGMTAFEPFLMEMQYLDERGAEIHGAGILLGINPRLSESHTLLSRHLGDALSENKTPVNFALSFMHCKNVTIEDAPVPRKVHDKRVKNGKHGGYTFKTLEIGGLRSQSASEKTEGESELKRALHICRGHFKTYTKDNPLFGHFTGTVWVPMHTRGDAKNGVVKKDYRVRAPQ